jgi:hypothetical protein
MGARGGQLQLGPGRAPGRQPSSPLPARPRGARRTAPQLQLGHGARAADGSSSATGRAPGRQPSSPLPARPRWRARRTAPARAGGARVGRLQLGPERASDSPSSGRWRAPGRQPSSPLPARPRWRVHVGQLQLGHGGARGGRLQLGPVARARSLAVRKPGKRARPGSTALAAPTASRTRCHAHGAPPTPHLGVANTWRPRSVRQNGSATARATSARQARAPPWALERGQAGAGGSRERLALLSQGPRG